jgi:putative transposase
VAGGTYFFTVALRERGTDLLVREIGALRDSVRSVLGEMPFRIDACVVLPDHLHCIWTLPPGDADFAGRWQRVKRRFSEALPAVEARTAVMAARGERGVWQRRYWEHTVRDARDFALHMDYVHFNPVKHGFVSHAADWPLSSFRRCVAAGFYPADWGGGGEEPAEIGE